MFEKVGLSIDYCLRYAKYGLETLLHVFDHPACFLQSLRQLAGRSTAIALQDVYGSSTTLRGVPDTRKVTKEAWYKPIKQRYDMDWDRWGKNYELDMNLWQSIQDSAIR